MMRAHVTRSAVIRTLAVALLGAALAVSLAGCTTSTTTEKPAPSATATAEPSLPTSDGAATAEESSEEAAKDYAISDVKIGKVAGPPATMTVTGKVKNNGDRAYELVMLTADLYKGGVKIAGPDGIQNGDAASGLAPGGTYSFSVIFKAATPEQDAAMAKLLEADEAKVSVTVLKGLEY
jgi:hypothetical protein